MGENSYEQYTRRLEMARAVAVPPYGSVRAFLRFLAQAPAQGWPGRVDVPLLTSMGFRGGAAWELLLALRFLGLVDAEGRPLPRYALVLAGGDELRRGLREAVYAAYAFLWQEVDLATASREELEEAFRRRWPSLATRQARFLIGLCRATGIYTPARFKGSLSIATSSPPRQGREGAIAEVIQRLERAEAELARLRQEVAARRPWWAKFWDRVRKRSDPA